MKEFMQVSAFPKEESLAIPGRADRQFDAGDEDSAVAYFRRLRASGKYEYITLEWLAAAEEGVKV